MFSSFLDGKSPNGGIYAQAYRSFYTAEAPGGIKQVYYFSPCNFELIDYNPALIEAGVDLFKFERRMKSAEHTGSAAVAYRYVTDHYKEDQKVQLQQEKEFFFPIFITKKDDYVLYYLNSVNREKSLNH